MAIAKVQDLGDAAVVSAKFDALVAAMTTGDVATFLELVDERAIFIDEDIPFVGVRADFLETMAWHGSGLWDAIEWKPRQRQFERRGSTGIVAGYATFRGKPKDAGYRQRHLCFSQGWAEVDGTWKLVNWHISAIEGHVNGASPG